MLDCGGLLGCGLVGVGSVPEQAGAALAMVVLVGEVVLVPEVLVELAGELGGAGAEGGAAALEEEDRDQAALGRSE